MDFQHFDDIEDSTRDLQWRRSSRCGTAACVDVARDGDKIVARDGKFGAASNTLVFSVNEWLQVLEAIRHGKDHPDIHVADGGVWFGGDGNEDYDLFFNSAEWRAFEEGVLLWEFEPEKLSTSAPASEGEQVADEVGSIADGSDLAATGADKGESVSGGTAPVAAPSGPATFRKKPVEIQAMRWTSDDVAYDITDWAGGSVTYDPYASGPSDPETGDDWGRLEIETLEGPLVATPRDWIIRGVKGEFYPCKPDIFAATYEAVPEPAWGSGPLVNHGGTP